MPVSRKTRYHPGGVLLSLAVCASLAFGAVLDPVQLASRAELHDEERAQLLLRTREALEAYRVVHGGYPSTEGNWRGDCPVFGAYGYGPEGYIPGLAPEFLDRLPCDPDPRFPDFDGGIAYRSDGQDFKLLLYHTPGAYPRQHEFLDLERPYWAWQVSTPGARDW